jgi:hypothetical protein
MRTLLALSFALSITGCNAEIVTYGPPPGSNDPNNNDPNNNNPNNNDPNNPNNNNPNNGCPTGQHLDGMTCVADEVTCAEEFPCPNGQTCSGGRCITVPGPCASNDDCPSGDACVNGQCAPVCPMANPQCKTDKDCGPNNVCVACMCVSINNCQMPTADLSGGAWAAHQDLHLDEALGAFGQGLVGILKKLRDGILGCPQGSSGDCFLFEIVASFLPQWAQDLIVAVGNFGDLIDNHDFLVDSTMTFTKSNKPSSYNGTDHWNMLTFSYQNHVVMEKPENVPQIGKPIDIPFTASGVCGILYVDKHKVEGVLSGILKWMVDTVVQIATCDNQNANVCYMTLSDAIVGSIDCSQVQDIAAQAACFAFVNGLAQKIDDLLNQFLLNYSLMTLKGTAVVNPNGKALTNGHWDGTLGDGIGIFQNFTGEWSASR